MKIIMNTKKLLQILNTQTKFQVVTMEAVGSVLKTSTDRIDILTRGVIAFLELTNSEFHENRAELDELKGILKSMISTKRMRKFNSELSFAADQAKAQLAEIRGLIDALPDEDG